MNDTDKSVLSIIGGGIGAALLALTGVALMIACQVVVMLGLDIAGVDYHLYDGVTTTLYSLLTIGVMLVFLKILKCIYDEPAIKVGKLNAAQICLTIVVSFGLMGCVNLYLVGANYLTQVAPEVMGEELEKYSESVDRYAEYEAEVIPNWDHILEFIGVAFLVPLAEELTFRGVILGALLKKFRPSIAVLLSAVIFGILHGLSIHIGYALLCGIIIGWVYFYTESIKATFMLHALFNLMGSALVTFLDSGMFGDLGDAVSLVSGSTFLIEIICIPPAIASFVFLRMIYKSKYSAAKAAESEENGSGETAPSDDSSDIMYV